MADQAIKQVFVQFQADSSQMRQEMAKDTAAINQQAATITAAQQKVSAFAGKGTNTAQLNTGIRAAFQEMGAGLKATEAGSQKAAAGLAKVGGGGQQAAAGIKAAAIPLVNQLAPGLGAVVGASTQMASAFSGLGPMAVGVGIAITGLSLVIADVVSKMQDLVEWQNKLADVKVGTSVSKVTQLYEQQAEALRIATRTLQQAEQPVNALVGAWNFLTNATGRARANLEQARARLMGVTAAAAEQFAKIEEGRTALDVLKQQADHSQALAQHMLSTAKGTADVAAAYQQLNQVAADNLEIARARTELRLQEIAADQGMSPAQKANEEAKALAELSAAQDTYYLESRQRSDAQLAAEQQKRDAAEQAYRETIQQERSLMDLRVQLGQETIASELAFYQRRATDARASGEEQYRGRLELQNRIKALDDQYFNIRKVLGDTTLKDEVQRQRDIVNATQQSTQQRLTAEQELAAKTAELRAASMSAFERAVQAAGKAIEERGGQISLGGITAELEKNISKGKDVLADFSAGMTITAEKGVSGFQRLQDALGAAGMQRAFEQVGGVAAGMSQGLQGFMEDIGLRTRNATQELSTLVQTAREFNLEAGLSRMEQGFSKSFDVVLRAADTFIEQFNAKIQQGTSQIAESLYQGFTGRLVRDLQEEARRS